MNLFNFTLCVFLCIILNNNQVQSQICNNCECKPNKNTFSCDCTRKFTNMSCFKERSHKLIITQEELLIPFGRIDLSMIKEFNIHGISIKEFNSVNSSVTLDSLKTFILNSCDTRKIDKNAFWNMRRLTKLEIENNYISSLESDIFEFTEKLEILKLRSNSIDSISEEIFKKLSYLSDISLDNNKIQVLPKNLFKNNMNLKYISLSNNKIKEIEENIFSVNYKIEKILLNNNFIQKLPAKIFQNHTNIFEISLNNNKIQILPNSLFKNVLNLRMLKLDNNEISLIEKDAFYNNTKLEALYLNNNKLKYIEANIIKNCANLRFLNLNNNSIKCDCSFVNFFTIYKTRHNATQYIECAEPATLKNKNFNNLQNEDFVCPAKILNCIEIITKPDNKNNLTTVACKYYGYPKPELSWTINNEKIARNNKNYNMSNVYLNNDTFWSNLTIFNVSSLTKGQYKLNVNNKGGNDNYSYNLDYNEESNMKLIIMCSAATGIFIIAILCIVIGCICWKHKREDAKNYPSNTEHMEMADINLCPSPPSKQKKRSSNKMNTELTYIRADRVDSYYTDLPQIIPKLDSKSKASSEYSNGRFADTSREVNKLLLVRRTANDGLQEHDLTKQNKDKVETVLPNEKYETIQQWFRKSDPLNAENIEITTDNFSQNDSVQEDINLVKTLQILKRNSNYMYDAIENEDETIYPEDIYDNQDINNNKLDLKYKSNEVLSNFLIDEMFTSSIQHLNIASNTALVNTDSTKDFYESKRYSEDINPNEAHTRTEGMEVEKHFSFHQSEEVIEDTINFITLKHNDCNDSL